MFTLAEPKTNTGHLMGREPMSNTVRLGRYSGAGKCGYQPRVSIAADVAERLGVKIGDRYNVLIGSGTDAGRFAIQPAVKGRNKFGKSGKCLTATSLLIPMREGKFKSRDTHFVIEGGCLVIDIPLDLRVNNMAVAAE